MYVCIYIYIYRYIQERERERERDVSHTHAYIHISMYSNAYTCTHTYHARTEMRFRMGVRGVKYLYKGEVLAYKSADSYDDLICAMSQFVRKDPPPSLGTNEIVKSGGVDFTPPSRDPKPHFSPCVAYM